MPSDGSPESGSSFSEIFLDENVHGNDEIPGNSPGNSWEFVSHEKKIIASQASSQATQTSNMACKPPIKACLAPIRSCQA